MLPLSAWAQKVTVKGLVTNEDGEALPYIRVIGNRGQAGIETNDRGEYQLQLNRQDTLYLEFQAMDYEQKEIAIPRPTQDVVVQNVKLETIGVTLGVVTVTEQFRQRVEETTASLQTVSSKRLDQFANTNIMDAISMVPGVTIYDEQPSIRGSSGYTYGAGSRVLTLLNGLPMLSADRGSVTFDMLPTDNVAQVEVFKGATSVLYGAGAMGGVINVITADPADTPRTVVRIRAGMFDAPRNRLADWDGRSASVLPSVHVFHSRRIGEHLDFTAQADVMKEGGYRRDEFSDRLRILLMPKYRFAKNFYLGFNTQLSIDSSATVIAYRDYPRGALLPGPGFLSMQVLYRMSFDPYLTYIGQKSQHLYQGRIFHQSNEINTGQSGTATLIYHEYQFKRSFWKDKIQTVFGVNYTRNQVTAAQTFGSPYSDGLAGFLQAKFKFGQRLNVVLGVRYQYEMITGQNTVTDTLRDSEGRYVKRAGAIEDDGFVTRIRRLDPERKVPINDPLFRIGLNYRAGEATYIRASWGQAIRSPSVAERYTSTFAGPLQVKPNPNINVERGWSAEVGVRQLAKFGAFKGFVDAAAFTMQFKDLAEFYADTASLLRGEAAFTAQNVSAANVTGGELILGFDWKPVKNFGVLMDVGVTFTNPVDFDGKKSWDGDDSTDVVAAAAIRALGRNTSLAGLIAPPVPIPADRPYILKYRNKWLVRANLTLSYKQFSFTTNYSYSSPLINVDKVFLIDLIEHNVPLRGGGELPITEELLRGLGLTRLFPDVRRFRAMQNKGWHLVDFVLAANYGRNTISFHVFNAFNEEYMTIPGTIGKQRNFAVQWKITL